MKISYKYVVAIAILFSSFCNYALLLRRVQIPRTARGMSITKEPPPCGIPQSQQQVTTDKHPITRN